MLRNSKGKIKIKNYLYISFSILLIFIIACESKYTDSMPAAKTIVYRACNTVTDCMYITNGCCDCSNGGESLAINKTLEQNFRDNFNCENIACTEMYSNCAEGTVACENSLCIYTAPANF